MPQKGRKRPDSFTIIVVPHTERSSFSLRIPFWSILVGLGLCAVAVSAVALVALDRHDAQRQLAELRRAGQVNTVQQAQLRQSILAEQQQEESLRSVIASQSALAAAQEDARIDEAGRMSAEVSRLYEQIEELESFKADIRRIVGLDKVTPVPTAVRQPTPQPAQDASSSAIGPLEPLSDERLAATASSRGAERTSPADDVIQSATMLLEDTIPQQKADLESLRQEVADRVAKVGNQWQSAEQLSRELSLYDASPRAWPLFGSISARFGYDARRLDLGAQPFHKGIDITGWVGSPVYAPQDGVVISAGWNGSFGLELEVRHAMGWSTLYAHLSTIPVRVGENVKKGQVIGYVGMTGLTTGPHLHYEIHLNGTPVDPLKYVGR